jgi:hypothetical protein
VNNFFKKSLDKWAFMGYIIVMTNNTTPTTPNANLDKSHPLRDMIEVRPEETLALEGWEGCWAGDGSGMDDFADWNAQEGFDC